MFNKFRGIATALLASVGLAAEADVELTKISHPERDGIYDQPRESKPRPGYDAIGQLGRRNKVSSAARRANVYGKQVHGASGQKYISYAEHDRRTRDRISPAGRYR